ncbi:hypothetical protein, partial [Rheinheimera sediminis]|uniref:hypothetical protein n=1 Tax=Rheinheimera sp. YQF-1 TaxID=2499626 RepID=UPI001644A88B
IGVQINQNTQNEDARLFFANLPALKEMVNNRFDEYQNGWLIQFHQWLLNLQPVIDCDEVIAAFNKFAEHYRTT